MQVLPLNGFNQTESKKLGDLQAINWIPTVSGNDTLSPISLMPSSGVTYDFNESLLWDTDYQSGDINGQVVSYDGFNSAAQFIVGRRIVGATSNSLSASNNLPGTPTGGGPVVSPGVCSNARFATNGTKLISVGPSYSNGNQDRGYEYDSSLSPTAIDLQGALGSGQAGVVDIAFIGGRFLYLCNNVNFNRVHYSGLTTIEPDALDFFTPQGNDEQLLGMEVLNRRLYLFSETRCWIYQTTQDVTIPYAEVGSLEYGLAGDAPQDAQAKCKYKGTIAFYGKQKNGPARVYLMSGSSAQPVSNPNIDRILAENRSGIRLFAFAEKGREFLCVRTNTKCFLYEAETGYWHERKTYPEDTWAFIGAAPDGTGNSILIGDQFKNVDGNLFTRIGPMNFNAGTELASSLNTDNTQGLVERVVVTSPFNANNDRMILSELEPQLDIDYSLPVDGWSNTEIRLRMSFDFGNTFEAERSIRFTEKGNYGKRSRFAPIGFINQAFVCQFKTFNPYPVRFIKLLARTTKGYA